MSKKALITGVTGQDGSYLAELLLEKGYEVHGMVRRSSVEKRERIDHLEGNPNFTVHYGDLSDSLSLVRLIGSIKPDEIYNLAAQSHVGVSFDVPEYTADVVATGVLRVLEAVRICGLEDLPYLSGFHFRVIWKSRGSSTARDNTVPPIQPVCSCKTVRFLDRKRVP